MPVDVTDTVLLCLMADNKKSIFLLLSNSLTFYIINDCFHLKR